MLAMTERVVAALLGLAISKSPAILQPTGCWLRPGFLRYWKAGQQSGERMRLVFMTCAQSSAVDSQTGRLSLFHLLEQVQATSFPTVLSLTLVGMFAREAGEADDQFVKLKVDLEEKEIFESSVSFSFRGKLRSRVLMAINGLAIPSAGMLSFSFLSGDGAPLGAPWDVIVEKAHALQTPAQAT
jgi:hypothetical protein